MTLEDYINGERSGTGAHNIELEAMRDPMLADALEGFDAVPGDHAAAFDRLAAKIEQSGARGHAAARAHSARSSERVIRGWSIAAASLFLVIAAGGGVWLLKDGVTPDKSPAPKISRVARNDEVVQILPPVTVISNDEQPDALATDPADVRFDRAEVPVISETEIVAAAGDDLAGRDTLTTVAFRRHVNYWSKTVSTAGSVTLSFEVGADGRPVDIKTEKSPSPETAKVAEKLLREGPDWPLRPTRKLVTINL